MLSHHSCIGMSQLPSHPFHGHVARQHLTGKRMSALVGSPVPNICLFQMRSKPVAQGLAVPKKPACAAPKQKPDFLFFTGDVVALNHLDLNAWSLRRIGKNLSHQLRGGSISSTVRSLGAFLRYLEFPHH